MPVLRSITRGSWSRRCATLLVSGVVAGAAAAGGAPPAGAAPAQVLAAKPAPRPVAVKPVVKPAPKPPACVAVTKPAAKKPVAKKPVKKPVAKKPVKKPVAKKPVAKKPVAKKPLTGPGRCKTKPVLAPLPVPAAALARQPGPIATPPDAPLVPTVQTLGRTNGTFFGTHVFGPANASAWPGPVMARGLGSVRLWDTGTTWSDLEPARGTWAWGRLDAAVDAAVAHGYSPLLVLGQTPTWASSDPDAPGFLQPGGSVPPADMATWRTYVSTVATRYAGRIAAYEIWNEPNYVGDYFHGSEADMAELSSTAYDAVKAADPDALVVSPGMATRTRGQYGWIIRYFDQPKARRIDAISLHLYPQANELPEVATGNLAAIATTLAGRGMRKPVWNTEVNYGVVGGISDAVAVPEPLGSAYVVRTLLMDRAAGVDRIFWYGWTQSRLLGIAVAGSDDQLTAPAQAWLRASRWLSRSTLVGCARTDAGYACSLLPDGGGWAQVLWQPTATSAVRAPKDTAGEITLDGSVISRGAGDRIPLDASPVLVFGGGAGVASLS